MIRAFNCLSVFVIPCLLYSVQGEDEEFCWDPRKTPFRGQPSAERLSSDRVRIDWSNIFIKNSNCQNVDFLIKSNPRHSPSDYKLSDFTLKGQTSATLMVTDGEDFEFQVIAREDKGQKYGIEYKYSPVVTSYFREETALDVGFKEDPPTEKLRVVRFRQTTTVPMASTVRTTKSSRRNSNASERTCPLSPKRVASDPIIKEFLAYLNQNSIRFLQEFIKDKRNSKTCGMGLQGFVVEFPETQAQKCCSSPWGGKCFMDFAECDGSCIPKDWVSDGWPDCLDGRDEPGLDGNASLVEDMHCMSCGGSVLLAMRLCRHANQPLAYCVKEFVQGGNCESCLRDYLQ